MAFRFQGNCPFYCSPTVHYLLILNITGLPYIQAKNISLRHYKLAKVYELSL